ncbi:MAG: DUF342 domain-containing protein [Burkholderiales bacterium]|nr:DUF342 domain-containing protein [Burkholderiales bacterium]
MNTSQELILSETTPSALTFGLSPDGRKLVATFIPVEGRPSLDITAIKGMLAQQGLSALLLDEAALGRLVEQYRTFTESFALEVGERQDGRAIVDLAQDRMTAYLTVTPPRGGQAVSLAQVHEALRAKGVVSGILNGEITEVLAQGHTEDHIVARGLDPVPGVDARFESLLPEVKERHPKVDERGIADYRDLGQLIFVKQGDPLMRRVPATAGEAGHDVTGQILAPKAGKNTPFSARLQGAAPDPGDVNLLRAATTGQPVQGANGVSVDSTLNLPQVDISSGHLHFEGTVNVQGDVKDGMKIHASGDVFVGGAVEAAEIEAGGNVVIKGGVIGRSEFSGSSDNASVFSAKIRSKGSINALYTENACLEADADIFIDQFSMHSELTALNQIIVGKPGSKRGSVMGGHARATALVKAAEFGSIASVKTTVQAGFNPYIQERLKEIKSAMAANEKEQEDLRKIIVHVQQHPEKDKGGLLQKVKNTLATLRSAMDQLEDEKSDVNATVTLATNAHVIVGQAIHGGTTIQIGHKVWRTTEQRGSGIFRLVDGEIEFGSAK